MCTEVTPLSVDVLKFFGCELGAQTKYDKTSGTCIVNGEAFKSTDLSFTLCSAHVLDA